MSENITLITCTGGRPEAFELCQKYMKEQTLPYTQWIVVHDMLSKSQVKEVQKDYPEFELYPGPRTWREGLNTQRFNMEEALKHVEGDYIFVIEDDDLYFPNYLESMMKILKGVEMAGIANNRYYNLSIPGFKEMGNMRHSSLCTTGFRKEALPLLQSAVDSGELYFDMWLWAAALKRGVPFSMVANSGLSIGIKGMPGKGGIGSGHRFSGFAIDPNLVKLKEWLPDEYVKNYTPYIKKFSDLPAAVAAPKTPIIRKPLVAPPAPKAPVTKTAPQIKEPPKAAMTPVVKAQEVPEMLTRVLPKPAVGSTNLPQTTVQKAQMALMPQSAGMSPQASELTQSANTYPTGERSQGDVFK